MKAIGEQALLSRLKSKTILKRKPNLTICSNHLKEEIYPKRIWNSSVQGTAISNGGGWYQ